MRENAATLDAGEMIAYPLVTEDERTEHEHARRVQELRAHHERHLRTQGFRVVDGGLAHKRGDVREACRVAFACRVDEAALARYAGIEDAVSGLLGALSTGTLPPFEGMRVKWVDGPCDPEPRIKAFWFYSFEDEPENERPALGRQAETLAYAAEYLANEAARAYHDDLVMAVAPLAA